MRTALLVAIAVCSAWSDARSTDPPKPPYDLDFVANFVAGEYVVIGRKPESDATYTGRMIFTREGKDLEFTRTVGGDTQFWAWKRCFRWSTTTEMQTMRLNN
jgi:hypothetical protein